MLNPESKIEKRRGIGEGEEEKELQGGKAIPELLKKHYQKLLEKNYGDFTKEVMNLPDFSFEAKDMEQVGRAFNEIDVKLSLYDLLSIIIRAKALKDLPSDELREIGWRAMEPPQLEQLQSLTLKEREKEREKNVDDFIKASGGEREAYGYLVTIPRSLQKMLIARDEIRKNLESEMHVMAEKSGKSERDLMSTSIEYGKLWRIAESYKMVDREFENYSHYFANPFVKKLGLDKIDKFDEELEKES